MKKVVAIRVDVDTSLGLKKGVPRLLSLFEHYQIPATFFVVIGPDSMGQHAKRFRRKEYWKRIWKVNPFKLIKSYGITPFFYGTLLRAPMVGEGNAALLRRIEAEGHEVSVHGFNHACWADNYFNLTPEEVEEELNRSYDGYREIFETAPSGFAAPNWRSDEKLYVLEGKKGFLYASDVRGKTPFFPQVAEHTYTTLQIPPTLPTVHECLQEGTADREGVVDFIVGQLGEGVNVLNIHDWYEGLSEPGIVENFIQKIRGLGYNFLRLSDIARQLLNDRSSIPQCKVIKKKIRGGIGEVTCQVT